MHRFALLCLLGLACAPAASGPVLPSTPPTSTRADLPPTPATPTATPTATALATVAATNEAVQPIPAEINRRYEKADARKWAKRFEREGREAFDHRDEIVDLLALDPAMTVADIGAGSGLFTMAFSAKLTGGTVIAVDVQDYFLDHIRERAAKSGAKNITFVKAGQRAAGLAPGGVDVVFLCDVYHHIEFPKSYLASLLEALRPGGRLVMIDFIAKEGASEDWVLEHVRATPEAFKAEIEAAGFTFSEGHDLLRENFFYVFTKPKSAEI